MDAITFGRLCAKNDSDEIRAEIHRQAMSASVDAVAEALSRYDRGQALVQALEALELVKSHLLMPLDSECEITGLVLASIKKIEEVL